MNREILQAALEKHYKKFLYGEWWVDTLNDDWVYIATFKYRMITDIECQRIARKVKRLLKDHPVKFIWVGPFVWNFNGEV